VNGDLTVGGTTPVARLAVQNVGGNDTTKLLAFDEGSGTEFYLESGFAGAGPTGNGLKLRTAWDETAMSWRGDGKVGVGVTAPTGRLTVEHGLSGGLNETAITARNLGTGAAIALFAESFGTDATAVITNAGTGEIFRGFNGGGSPVFRITHAGKTVTTGLEVTSGPLIVDSSSRIRMVGAFGGGVGGAPVYVDNTTSNGIAFWGKVTGTGAPAVFEQNGSGALIRAFTNGSLKFEVRNNGRVVTPALEITGGGDLAEPFDVEGDREPGTVLVIDDQVPGRLVPSSIAYDRRVAGVVSGAGGILPGIIMSPEEATANGAQVALTGRVYAKADAGPGPIRPGDLLTTSDRPGHLMRATDPERTAGAVVGKAMSALADGQGLVLVLVTLQ
jgi:hypothetical protein